MAEGKGVPPARAGRRRDAPSSPDQTAPIAPRTWRRRTLQGASFKILPPSSGAVVSPADVSSAARTAASRSLQRARGGRGALRKVRRAIAPFPGLRDALWRTPCEKALAWDTIFAALI